MATPTSDQILFRLGDNARRRVGRIWMRADTLDGIGAPVFTRPDGAPCATYVDRGGLVRVAAADKLRIEWVDLDGDGIRETPGILLEGSRTNLCLRSEEFDHGTWTGLATVTANTDVAPDGTTTADTLTDDDAAAFEFKIQTFTVANDSLTHVIAIFVKKTTAATNTFGLNIALSGGTGVSAFPRLNTNSGLLAGAAAAQVFSVGNYWLLICPITNNTTGNTSLSVQVFPATGTNSGSNPGTDNVAATGSAVVWGAQVEKAPCRSSYLKTVASAVTRAADTFTMPFGFGPDDITVLRRVARPVWAGAGTPGLNPATFQLSTAVPYVAGNFATSGNVRGLVDGTVADALQETAFPAGSLLEATNQFKDLGTSGAVAVDVGNGPTSFVGGATPFAVFGNQTLQVGNQLFAVLVDLVIARGLFTHSEMLAAL
jgi:hypothetical protein